MPLEDWTDAELEELALRVWGAVEYGGGRSGSALRKVIEEVNR